MDIKHNNDNRQTRWARKTLPLALLALSSFMISCADFLELDPKNEIIQEQLNLEGVEITEDSSFKDDLGADSLDLFELVMAFEEEYGVEIPSEDLEQITTVGAVIEYMKSKGVEA